MKKYINRILSAACIASAALATVACSSDYLDTKPTDSVSDATAVGTTENAFKSLNGIAETMTTQHYWYSQGMAGEGYIMIKTECYPSENYNYNYYASGWAPLFNMQFMQRTNTVYNSYIWAYYYNIIGQANTIIAHIDDAEGPDSEKKFAKASALTFRAYAFEKLARYYCPRLIDCNNGADKNSGLVLRIDESTGDLGRSTLSETYNQIYADLEEALKLFGESDYERSATEIWIPNKNVAHAVYARTALVKKDYQKALSEAKLARTGFALMSNDAYGAGFCNPTSEWIFGSFGGTEENLWYWSYGTQYACNGYYAGKMPTGAGAIGRELINRIPNEDFRKSLFLTEDKFPGFDFTYEGNEANGDANFCTYGILGDKNDDLWEAVDAYIESKTPAGLDRAYKSQYYYLDGQLKFYVFDTPGISYLPFIRSSEMVLIEAEANYFLNNPKGAQDALVELNATTGRNPNYTCSKSGQDLFNEIKDYRCLELWGEGNEWSDYKRWNLPISRKSFKQGGNNHTAVAIDIPTTSANGWVWSIPDAEVDYNSALKDPLEEEE